MDVVDLQENRVLTASCHRRPLSPRRLQRVTQLRTAHAVAASARALDRRHHRRRRRHRLLGSLTHHIRDPRSAARRHRLCHRLPLRHHRRLSRPTCVSTPFVALATGTLAAAAAPTAAVAVAGTAVGAATLGTYAVAASAEALAGRPLLRPARSRIASRSSARASAAAASHAAATVNLSAYLTSSSVAAATSATAATAATAAAAHAAHASPSLGVAGVIGIAAAAAAAACTQSAAILPARHMVQGKQRSGECTGA